jgi:hypothetical protein
MCCGENLYKYKLHNESAASSKKHIRHQHENKIFIELCETLSVSLLMECVYIKMKY